MYHTKIGSTITIYTPYTPRTSITPTQRRILQCAIETIADAGYGQATIGEISARLGLSKGVIQYHFSSKEELMQEAIAYIYATARNYMSSQIWSTTNEWEQIRSFIAVSCRFYRRYPRYVKALLAIRASFQPAKHASLAQTLYEQELADLARVFAVGQEKGVLQQFDPEIAALTLRLALNGVAVRLYAQKHPKDYDAEKHGRELIELFRRAWSA